jgi:hypothetical protein
VVEERSPLALVDEGSPFTVAELPDPLALVDERSPLTVAELRSPLVLVDEPVPETVVNERSAEALAASGSPITARFPGPPSKICGAPIMTEGAKILPRLDHFGRCRR